MSPDPDAGNLANPQSLNRYAYVINNPTNGVDPDGRRMTSPLAELGAGGAAGLYLSTLASDPTGSVGSNWDEFGALQQALTPTVLAPTAVSSIISSDYNPTDEISTTFSPAVVIYPNAGMLSVLDSVDPGPRQIGIPKIPNMPRRVNVAMLIAMAKRHFSATCNSDFGKVIPHYSKSKFFNSLSNAPVQQYPPGTNNIPSHDSGADADIGVDQPGLPIRLFPNFYGTDQSYQAFILVHEEVHRFTGWSDSQIFSNFAPFGLVPPESGYGTGGFTTWLQGGCKP